MIRCAGLVVVSALSVFATVAIPARAVAQDVAGPPPAGCVPSGRTDLPLTPEAFGARGNGHAASASDDTGPVQAALDCLATRGGGALLLAGWYRITRPLVLRNTPVILTGRGQTSSGLIDDGVPAAAYLLSIEQTDYTQPTTLSGFALHTRGSAARGLLVGYGIADAEDNHVHPQRFTWSNIDIGGDTTNAVGWRDASGFEIGAHFRNVSPTGAGNVTIAGRQTGRNYDQNSSMVRGIWLESVQDPVSCAQLRSCAAPTDPVFRDVQIFAAQVGFYGTGHVEGLIFDHFLCVACGSGITLHGTGAGSASINYPWVHIVNSHINAYGVTGPPGHADRSANVVISGYFDVKIANNVFYKWGFPGTEINLPSSAIEIDGCVRCQIAGNTFRNTTLDFGPYAAWDGIALSNGYRNTVSGNVLSGMASGVTLSGTEFETRYERGQWIDPPPGTDAVEFRVSGSGSGNSASYPLKQGSPASPTARCLAGERLYDAAFLYTCVADNAWRRAAIGTPW